MEYAQIGMQMAMGVSLSACAGLRAFLPLLALSLLQKFGYIHLSPAFQWLGSDPAVMVFGIATLLEILADKIPVVDHALDGFETVIKPTAGAVLFSSAIMKMDPLVTLILGIIVGGSISELIHLKKAVIRGGSTTMTAGIANPIISTIEDFGTVFGVVLSIIAPILAVMVLAIFFAVSFYLIRKITERKETRKTE